jgi:hypothetical protein
MPVVSQLLVANTAIGILPAKRIASIDEDSLEAREVRNFYPRAVADMLAGPFDHDWSFANLRVTLAAVANDRASEWLFAYQLPSNMASAIRVIPDLGALGSYPIPLGGDPYAEAWSSAAGYFETPYVIEGSTLYTNVENATLDYAINDIAGLNVSEKIITALSIDLAARLCVPLKKDSNRELVLVKSAETAWERAVAEDRNRQPTVFGNYVSEAMAARSGYMPDLP